MHYTRSEAKAWARENLVGQWTTMMTPFTPEDELDEKGLAANIEHVLRLGTHGLGFSWNMGEFWSVTSRTRTRTQRVSMMSFGRLGSQGLSSGLSVLGILKCCQKSWPWPSMVPVPVMAMSWPSFKVMQAW